MFGAEATIKIQAVTDGLSGTFLFGEMSRFRNEPAGSNFYFSNITGLWQGPPWSSMHVRSGRVIIRITGGAYQVPRLNAPIPTPTGACPCRIASRPSSTLRTGYRWRRVRDLGQFGFRSLHPGGGNFAMADGSVKFVKDGISLKTYRALGTQSRRRGHWRRAVLISILLAPARNRALPGIDEPVTPEEANRVFLEFPEERLMKRVSTILVLALPLLVIGCSSSEPPVEKAPVRVEPQSPPARNGRNPAVKQKKQPGLHSPMAPRVPKPRF